MNIPVLTYHATNIAGNDYHNNDHIAFAEDLHLIQSLNINIISTHTLVLWLSGKLALDNRQSYVALTFDDGSDLDYQDWQHPTHGLQRSFFSLMQEYDGDIHATSFVIASPAVRSILKDTCLGGHQIWGDHWWNDAEKSDVLSIENHSWDHVHVTLQNVHQKDNIKGDFALIDTLGEAQVQIERATDYINNNIGDKHTSLFAYPYGHHNDYLTKHYFPNQQQDILAAFTCQDDYVKPQTSRWLIPRFVCGLHWQNSAQLSMILRGDYQSKSL